MRNRIAICALAGILALGAVGCGQQAAAPSSSNEQAAERNDNAGGEAQAKDSDRLTEEQAKTIVWKSGLGEILSMKEAQHDDGLWYWEVTTKGPDGVQTTYAIDTNANITNMSR